MIWIFFLCMTIFFIAKMWQPEPEYAIPLGVFGTVLITYTFGLLDILRWQPCFMLGIALIMGGILAFCAHRGTLKKLDITHWLRFIFILGTVIALAIVYFYGHEILTNDDYNYYASVVKYLWHRDSLTGLEKVCGSFSEYHPIISLWHYYINKCFGSYQDWHLFFSYIMFLYVCGVPLLKKTDSQNQKLRIFWLVLYLIFPWTVSGNILYMMIGVDIVVGFLFGYTIYIIIDHKGKNWKTFSINTIICITMLGLSKSPAVLFAGICLIGYIVMVWHQEELSKKTKWSCSIITSVVSFGLIFSWKVYCNYVACFSHSNYMKILKRSITGEITRPAYTRKVIVDYINKLLFAPLNLTRGMTATIIVCAFLLILLICKKRRCIKKCEFRVCIVVFGGYAIFVLGHLWMYLYGFTESEALVMSAWVRYSAMYMIPILYLILMFVKKIRLWWIGGGVFILFLISMPWEKMIEYGCGNYENAMVEQMNHRHEMMEAVGELSFYIEEGDTIGIVYGEESLYYLRRLALKYELIPYKVSVMSYGSEENLRNYAMWEEWNKLFILTDINEDYHAGNIYKVVNENEEIDFIQIN